MADGVRARLEATLSGRYAIEDEIGAGGMATVYLARDLKHGRQVALKVLKPELASVVGADRFLHEIRVTAGLQHPHILSLHDSGDADSFLYYVMPYVEGESLRDRLNREGGLPTGEVLELLQEIADGLAYAHERGVVHRDIKPDNVLLSGRHALLADLGISKAVSDTTSRQNLTTAGVVLGTPEYMAPEQAAGDPEVDHRADIYAFGVLAYEMLTGRTPFGGRAPHEVLSAHLIRPPDPVSRHREDIPEPLDSLVLKCLEKSPADRWQSAEDILEALRGVAGGATPATWDTSYLTGKRARWRRWAPLPLGAVLVALASWVISLIPAGEVSARSRIAVLPFDNLSGTEDEYFSEGITRDINTRIAKIGSFVVIAHGSARQAKATAASYREMAQQLGVQYVVDGSVSLAEDRVLISAALIDPRTDEQLWTDDYDRELSAEHLFTIRGDVARQVALALDVTLSPEQEAELDVEPTQNLEAYQEYLLGHFEWEKRTIEGFQEAIRYFERAIALDSTYALAYAGLADVYLLRPWFSADFSNREGLALAEAMARRAIDLDPELARPYATLGLVHEWRYEWEESERAFVRAIDLDPEYATARHWYGNLLGRLGRHEQALAENRLSLDLDPLSPIISQDVGYVQALAGDLDAAILQYERTVQLHPDFATTVLVLGNAYLKAGRFDDAADVLARWAGLTGTDEQGVRLIVDLAEQYASTGQPQLPAGIALEEVFPPYSVASIYLALGQSELALDRLEEAYEDGAFAAVSAVFGQYMGRLRDHPRFQTLLEKVSPPQ